MRGNRLIITTVLLIIILELTAGLSLLAPNNSSTLTSIVRAAPAYYLPITITEQSGHNLTNYPVKIELNSTNFDGWDNVSVDGSDIFFTDSNDNPLYYWIESINTSKMKATIWVKIPKVEANAYTTIYMHYGANNPYSSYNNPDRVFILYDNFTSKNTTKWDWTSDWTVENGYAKQTYSSDWPPSGDLWSHGDLNVTISSGVGVVIEAYAKNLGTVSAYDMHLGWSNDTDTSNRCYVNVAEGTHDRWGWFGSLTQLSDWGEPSEREWNLYKLVIFNGHQEFYVNNVEYSEYSGSISKLGRIAIKSKGQSYWDWVIVRPYATPEPIVAVGATYGYKGNFSEPITIIERSGQTLSNYTVKIQLNQENFNDWGNFAAPNGEDIYFTDGQGNPLYYWIESIDTTNKQAIIWVKLPKLNADSYTTIYMHYGAGNPYSSYNNPHKVFPLYEDFDSSELSNWTSNTNTYSVSGGVIKFWGNWNGGKYFNSKEAFTGPLEIQAKVRLSMVGSDVDLFVGLTNESTGYIDSGKGIYFIYDGESTNAYGQKRIEITPNNYRVCGKVSDTQWHNIDIKYDGKTAYFTDDLLGTCNISYQLPGPYYLSIGADTDYATRYGYIDWILVKPYVNPEPDVVVGWVPPSSINAYNIPVTIVEGYGNTLVNYPIKVVLNTTNFNDWNKVKSNGSDIFVTDSNNNPLYYWIESINTTEKEAVIWVKVPRINALNTTTILLWYGGENDFTLFENPEKVFVFFEDFNSNQLDTNKWTIYDSGGASYTIANGTLYIDTGSTGENKHGVRFFADISFNSNNVSKYIVEARYKAHGWSNTDTSYTMSGVGVGRVSTNILDYKYLLGWDGHDNKYALNSWIGTMKYIPVNMENDKWYIIGLHMVSSSKCEGFVNGKNVATATWSIGNGPYGVVIGAQSDAHVKFWIDWIRVRPYTSEEPLVLVNYNPTPTTRNFWVVEEGGNNLTNVPVKVNITGSFATNFIDLWPNNVYFTLPDGTPLKYWIDYIDYGKKEAVFWIEVPSIEAYWYTTIELHYGGNNPYSSYYQGKAENLHPSTAEVIFVEPNLTPTSIPITIPEMMGRDYFDSTISIYLTENNFNGWTSLIPKTIYFTDKYGNPLEYRIKSISLGNKTAMLYVKIPYLISYSYYVVYLHYGGDNPYEKYRNQTMEQALLPVSSSTGPEWIPATSPSGRYVRFGITTYDGAHCYYVTTSGTGSQQYGYNFYAILNTAVFSPSQIVKIKGYIAVSDEFSSSWARGRRFAKLYIVSAKDPSKIIKTYQIADYTDTSWKQFEVVISGIDEPYKIAIGRSDWWDYDYRLYVYFRNIQVNSVKVGVALGVEKPILDGWSLRYPVLVVNTLSNNVNNPIIEIPLSPKFSFNVTRPDGGDIRVTDAEGNLLPVKIEDWNPEKGKGELLVQYNGIINAGENVTLYIFAGNYHATPLVQANLSNPLLTGTIERKDILRVFTYPFSPHDKKFITLGETLNISWFTIEPNNTSQVGYEVDIATDPYFSNIVYTTGYRESADGRVQVVDPITTSGIYYWRIIVKDGDGNYSTTWYLRRVIVINPDEVFTEVSGTWKGEKSIAIVNRDNTYIMHPVKIPLPSWVMSPSDIRFIGEAPVHGTLQYYVETYLKMGGKYTVSQNNLVYSGHGTDNTIEIDGLPASSYVEIYDENTMLVYFGQADTSGKLVIQSQNIPVPLDGQGHVFIMVYKNMTGEHEVLLPYWIGYGEDGVKYAWVLIPSLPASTTTRIKMIYNLTNVPYDDVYGYDKLLPDNIISLEVWYQTETGRYHPNNYNSLNSIFYDAKVYGLNKGEGSGFISAIYDSNTGNNNPFGGGDHYAKEYRVLIIPKETGTWKFATDSDDASHIIIVDAETGETTKVAGFYGSHGFLGKWNYYGSISLEANHPYILIYRQEEATGGDGSRMAFIPPGGSSWIVFTIDNAINYMEVYGIPDFLLEPVIVKESEFNMNVFNADTVPSTGSTHDIVVYNPYNISLYDVLVPVKVNNEYLGADVTGSNIRIVGTVFNPSNIIGIVYADLKPGVEYSYSNGILTASGSTSPQTVKITGLPPNTAVFIDNGAERNLLGLSDRDGVLESELYKEIVTGLILVSGTENTGSLPYVVYPNINGTEEIVFRALELKPGINTFKLYIGDYSSPASNYGESEVFQYTVDFTSNTHCLGLAYKTAINTLSSTPGKGWCRVPYALAPIGEWVVSTNFTLTSTTGTDGIPGGVVTYTSYPISVSGIHSRITSYQVSSTLKLYFNKLYMYNNGDGGEVYAVRADESIPMREEVFVNASRVDVRMYIPTWMPYRTLEYSVTPPRYSSYWFPLIELGSGQIQYKSYLIGRMDTGVVAFLVPTKLPTVSKSIPVIVFSNYTDVKVINPNDYPLYNVVVPIKLTNTDMDLSLVHQGDVRVTTTAPILDMSSIEYAVGKLEPGKSYEITNGEIVEKGSLPNSAIVELHIEPYDAVFLSFENTYIPIAYDMDGDGVVTLKLNKVITGGLVLVKTEVGEDVGVPYFIGAKNSEYMIIYARIPYIPGDGNITVRIYYNNPSISSDPVLYGPDKVFILGDSFNYPSGSVSYDKKYSLLLPFFTPRNSYGKVYSGEYLEVHAEQLTNAPPTARAALIEPIPITELSAFYDNLHVAGEVYSADPESRVFLGLASSYTMDYGIPSGDYVAVYQDGDESITSMTVSGTSVSYDKEIVELGIKPVLMMTLDIPDKAVKGFVGTDKEAQVGTNLLGVQGIVIGTETPTTWKVFWIGLWYSEGTSVIVQSASTIAEHSDQVVTANPSQWSKSIPVRISNPATRALYDYTLRVNITPTDLGLGLIPSDIQSKIRFIATYPVAEGDILKVLSATLEPGHKYRFDPSTSTLTDEGTISDPYLIKINTGYTNGIAVELLSDGKVVAVGRDYDHDGYVELESTSQLSGVLAIVKGEYKQIYLPYWCDAVTPQVASCWVKIPYIPQGNSGLVTLVYSDTGRTPSDTIYGPRKVFLFYEDFESGSLSNWIITGAKYGSCSITSDAYSGQYAVDLYDGSWHGTVSILYKKEIRVPFIESVEVKYSTSVFYNNKYPFAWEGAGSDGSLSKAFWGVIVNNQFGYQSSGVHTYYAYYNTRYRKIYGYNVIALRNVWYNLKVIYDPYNHRHITFVDNLYVGTGPDKLDNGKTVSYFTKIGISASNTYDESLHLYVDNIIVRKYVYPEPVAFVGDISHRYVPEYEEAGNVISSPNMVPIDIESKWSETYYDTAVKVDLVPSIANLNTVSDPTEVRFVADYVIPEQTISIMAIDLTKGGNFSFDGNTLHLMNSLNDGIQVTGLSSDTAVEIVIPGRYTILAYDYDNDGSVFIPIGNYRVLMPTYTGILEVVKVKFTKVLLPYVLTYKGADRVTYWVRIPYIIGNGLTRIYMYYGKQYGTDNNIYGMDKVFARNLVYLSTYHRPNVAHPTSTSAMDSMFSKLSYDTRYGSGFVSAIVHSYNPYSGTRYASYYFAIVQPKYNGTYYFATDSGDASDVLLYEDGGATRVVVANWYSYHGVSMTWNHYGSRQLNTTQTYLLVYRQEYSYYSHTSALGVGLVSNKNIKEFNVIYWPEVMKVYTTPVILPWIVTYPGGKVGYGGIDHYVVQWVGNDKYPPFFWFNTSTNVQLKINGGTATTYGSGEHWIILPKGKNTIEIYVNDQWVTLISGTAEYVNEEPKFTVSDIYKNGTVIGYMSIGGVPYPVISGKVEEAGKGTISVPSYTRIKIDILSQTVNLAVNMTTLIHTNAKLEVPVVIYKDADGNNVIAVSSTDVFGGFLLKLDEGLIVFQGVTNVQGYIDPAAMGLNPNLLYVAVGETDVYHLSDVWNPATLWIEVKP